MHHVCEQIYDNRNASAGTGANRLGSYARGAGYRSTFIRNFCDSPELAKHLSEIAGVTLGRHSVPAVACGINYAPDDITKAIDTWHVDSVAFDVVMMLSDPTTLKGGEFQVFDGTKHEGQALLGIEGEEGRDAQLPDERVITIPFLRQVLVFAARHHDFSSRLSVTGESESNHDDSFVRGAARACR